MHSRVPRAMLQVFEPIVSIGYGSPEVQAACEQLGLTADRMGYYAMRSAPLGPVSAEVVAALFYHHTVDMIAPSIPLAWRIASPETVIAARFEAVDRAYRRLLPQQIQSAEVAEAAELVREALTGCSTAGRTLFAAHASVPSPAEPHVALWHGLNQIREYRGDGHVIASIAARLPPHQAAPMLIACTGEEKAGRSWRWTDDLWNEAVASLQERGWLTDDGRPTAEGLAARARIEDETDALSLEPWEQLGTERAHRLWTILRDLTQALIDQNAIRRLRTPIELGWPAQWPS
ncbi:MAG: hypothetical protein ETSY1_10390 [Candidatus Entotheonella factor]|uniref:SalK n=1 Tax=Entotheonella factor TaxID=1429438 RepID=W4LRH5_ENTF1|nr:MAG: hypothetical protein ETSY1_10390 [Candidatus Entotheonella factor]